MLLRLRTLALNFCIGAYTLFIGIFVIIIALMLTKSKRGKFLLNAWIRVMLFFIRYVGGISHKVQGLEKIKQEPTGVIMSNHQSMYETFLYQDLFFPVLHIAKQSLRHIPIFGWGLTMIGTIYIDRSQKRNAREQILEQGKKKLAEGFRLVIYPEGTRVPVDVVKEFKTGGATAAIDFGCKIFPVAHNAGEFWNKQGIIKTGTSTFVIGDPIDPQGRTARDVTEQVEEWVRKTRKEITTL